MTGDAYEGLGDVALKNEKYEEAIGYHKNAADMYLEADNIMSAGWAYIDA